MNGTFCFCAVRIFFCMRSSEASTSTRIPAARRRRRHAVEVLDVPLGDRDADDLDRGQPRREGARVVLGQDAR